MDKNIAGLVKRIRRYAEQMGYSDTTVSFHVLNGGTRLAELEAGGRMWPDTIEAAHARLDELGAEKAENEKAG
jgi:hypothetical protein